MKRRILSWFIRPPKKVKTKGDVLKWALYYYMYDRMSYGLCVCIAKAMRDKWHKSPLVYLSILPYMDFAKFNRREAIDNWGAYNNAYWWDVNDWQSRYRYMKWLIKQYKNEEL